jgi:hypothetical protein
MKAMKFGVTFDYLCPFARNAHESVLLGLAEGRAWKVNFLAFSLAQANAPEDDPAVWFNPTGQTGLAALQWGVAIRDHWPELFDSAHRALFAARHDRGLDINDPQVIAEAVSDAGCDPDAVAQVVSTGEPLCKIAGEHMMAAGRMAFGVPTFITDEQAVFARFMDRDCPEDIDQTLQMLSWNSLNEYKHTTIPR